MDRQAISCCTDCGVPVLGIDRASALPAKITARAPPVISALRIVQPPRICDLKLLRRPDRAQSRSVAKLIQSIDNSRPMRPQPLPASHCFSYHTAQFGKVAFAV